VYLDYWSKMRCRLGQPTNRKWFNVVTLKMSYFRMFKTFVKASVAIGKPGRQVRKASHCGSKQQYKSPDEITIIACSRHIYVGVIIHAHPVRGESHIQRNVNGAVVTLERNHVKITNYCSIAVVLQDLSRLRTSRPTSKHTLRKRPLSRCRESCVRTEMRLQFNRPVVPKLCVATPWCVVLIFRGRRAMQAQCSFIHLK